MAESNFNSLEPKLLGTSRKKISSKPTVFLLSVLVIIPVMLATLVYQLDTLDPAPYPMHELAHPKPMFVPMKNSRLLHGSEKIGSGKLNGPEDVLYDPETGVVYTGCLDGWVKRIKVNYDSVADSVVEDWVNTGGRPVGLALGQVPGEVIVADTYKGLLKLRKDGSIELLTDEAEGVKFKLTNAVVVSKKTGIMYFTDASSKYDFRDYVLDVFEGRPYGRFMSYDPSAKETKVIVRDVYFANGVTLSPDEEFVIFCETPMRRCMRYYLQGEKEGSIDVFIDNLPGMPDNIRYDEEGHRYWIALASEISRAWELAQGSPFIRKILGIMEKYKVTPHTEKNGGAIAVDLEGKPIEQYCDEKLWLISTGTTIGDYLYIGSLRNQHIIRLNIKQHPAIAVS